jgi:shikimate kinase
MLYQLSYEIKNPILKTERKDISILQFSISNFNQMFFIKVQGVYLRAMKIYLLGYMGSGKSTVGKLLADQLKLDFIDFDSYIEKETGKSITEIFGNEGEVKFREIEHQFLKKLIRKANVVISLGGGTPCFHNNMDIINDSGTSIYLEVDISTLFKRLSNEKNARPLIRNLNDTELKNFIKINLEKRQIIYKNAQLSIPASLLSAAETTKEIKKRIKLKES